MRDPSELQVILDHRGPWANKDCKDYQDTWGHLEARATPGNLELRERPAHQEFRVNQAQEVRGVSKVSLGHRALQEGMESLGLQRN